MNKQQAFNIYMNKKKATKTTLSKLIKKVNKENTPPGGWTEEAKAGAKQAAAIGLSLETHKRGNKCNTINQLINTIDYLKSLLC